jgi:hypothetical protein
MAGFVEEREPQMVISLITETKLHQGLCGLAIEKRRSLCILEVQAQRPQQRQKQHTSAVLLSENHLKDCKLVGVSVWGRA